MKNHRILLGLVYVTSLIHAPVLHAAQVGPDPVPNNTVEGIVRRSDAAAGAVIVRAADGVEHLLHLTNRTVVHGKAATDALHGLREGNHVVVYYTAKGAEKTAVEVDHLGENGLSMIEGDVTQIDRKAKRIAVRLEDGSTAMLRLTGRAASTVAEDVAHASADATKVLVYYTDEGGQRVAHFFKRVS